MQSQTNRDDLGRLADTLADARQHERVLAADLAEVREYLEQLIEERWVALDELADHKATVWTELEAPKPGMVHNRRDTIMLALVTVTCSGVWALVGAVAVLVLRAS